MKKSLKFKNLLFGKNEIKDLVSSTFSNYGKTKTTYLIDDLKDLGFNYATKAGISISVEDLKVPPTKQEILKSAFKDINHSDLQYERGEINSVERFQKVLETWNNSGDNLKKKLINYFAETDPLNSIFIMAFSGARGNVSQVRQLVGMRGLMSDPNGQIIDIPIINNFREGLTITDYIMSSYGARKGVVDTALRTADSGYLTRRLVDVAQDVIVREEDCFSTSFIVIHLEDLSYSDLKHKLLGRVVAEDILYLGQVYVKRNEELTLQIIDKLYKIKCPNIRIRSPLTCKATRSICRKCYGWNLADGKLVELGEAVGIIAAQSIGEPGTQLTMRTFHTGGIFTSDSSRQVRSRCSGLAYFPKEIPLKSSRTNYGQDISLIGQSTVLYVQDYRNNCDEFPVESNTLVFFNNGSFVKKNQLLAELPLLNQQTVESQKNIVTQLPGQVFRQDQANILWILFGNVYDLSTNSLLNKLSVTNVTSNPKALFNFKIVSNSSGLVKFHFSPCLKRIHSYSIFNYFSLLSLPLFCLQDNSSYLLFDSEKSDFYKIKPLPLVFDSEPVTFAYSINEIFKPTINGIVYYADKRIFHENSKSLLIKQNTKILFIPESTHTVNRDASLILVSNGNFFLRKNVEIAKDIYSNVSGFIEIDESEDILRNIIIKPGKFFEYTKLSKDDKDHLFSLNNKIFFPGEVLFEDVNVDFPSLVQISHNGLRYGLLLRPIYQFNVPISNFNYKNSKSKVKITLNQKLNFNFGKFFYTQDNSSLVDTCLSLESKCFLTNPRLVPELRVIPDKKNLNSCQLVFISYSRVDICQLLPKNLQIKNFQFSFFVKELQYVEVGTILAKIYRIRDQQSNILQIRRSTNRKRLILVDQVNCPTYYSDFNDLSDLRISSVKTGDHLNPRLKLKYSGQIIDSTPFVSSIHKGMPFYLTDRTSLYVESGDLVLSGDMLGTISFNQAVTGDIVQGLPKIEEILEARKCDRPALLSPVSGIVLEIKHNNVLTILGPPTKISSKPGSNIWDVNLSSHNVVDFKIGSYIHFGQLISNGKLDFHKLLELWYNYHKRTNSPYLAACLSLRKVQTLLVAKVQDVYTSQGVSIGDKHIEVIIRQVTSKVQVNNPGNTLLLQNESLDLKQMNYINETMSIHNKKVATYDPKIFGITKASLLTESFISAASFQQTIKVLTQASIEGKIDWLRGLKENVIIGQLIPAGTGLVKE
jgi:DNA-directed RNA polymerase subunit beta'